MRKSGIIGNAFVLFGLGIRIEAYNRILFYLFRRRRLMFLWRHLDRRLQRLRKEFALLEERHRVMSLT